MVSGRAKTRGCRCQTNDGAEDEDAESGGSSPMRAASRNARAGPLCTWSARNAAGTTLTSGSSNVAVRGVEQRGVGRWIDPRVQASASL